MDIAQYEILEKLGGKCGVVYKAIIKETGQLVVLKRIRLEVSRVRCCCQYECQLPEGGRQGRQPGLLRSQSHSDEGVSSTALREISLLQMLSESNHIVK
jgi:cyclin-dependent kinase